MIVITNRSISLLLMFVVMVSALYPQDKVKLSIEQALQNGLQNNRMLKISDSKVKAALAKVNEVDASRYPWLKFSGAYTRLSEVPPFTIGTFQITSSILNNYNARLSAVQPLFMGNKISAGLEIAEIGASASAEDYRKDKDELSLNIKNAYWTLYKVIQFKKILDENVSSVNAHIKDAKNLEAQGLLTRNDILKIEVQLSDIKYKLADAKNSVQLAMLALNNAMNISLSTQVELTSIPEISNAELAGLDNLIGSSLENRPEIKSADMRIKMSESGVTVAKSGMYPQVSLAANYTYARPNSRIFPTKDRFDGTWDLSLALNYDIWNWNTTSHQTEQAEAQLMQAKEGMGITKDGVTMEVTSSYLSVKLAKEKIEIAEQSKSQSDENLRITNEKFKQGLALSSDLIDAEVANLTAKTNYTTAVVDYEIALAKLQKSTGVK